ECPVLPPQRRGGRHLDAAADRGQHRPVPLHPPTAPALAATPRSPARASRPHHRHHATAPISAPDLFATSAAVRAQALALTPDVPFKVYLPGLVTGPASANGPSDIHPYT